MARAQEAGQTLVSLEYHYPELSNIGEVGGVSSQQAKLCAPGHDDEPLKLSLLVPFSRHQGAERLKGLGQSQGSF